MPFLEAEWCKWHSKRKIGRILFVVLLQVWHLDLRSKATTKTKWRIPMGCQSFFIPQLVLFVPLFAERKTRKFINVFPKAWFPTNLLPCSQTIFTNVLFSLLKTSEISLFPHKPCRELPQWLRPISVKCILRAKLAFPLKTTVDNANWIVNYWWSYSSAKT